MCNVFIPWNIISAQTNINLNIYINKINTNQ